MAVDNPSNIVPDNLIVIEGGKQLVPAPAASDAGKVLGVVNASGDIGWVVDQSGTLTQVQANWAESDPSEVSYIQNKPTIPSKTSDLQNDSGFITSSDIPAIPTKTSDLQNDSGFITSASVPTKTSELQNDSGFITSSDIPAQVQANWNESNSSSAAYIQNKPSIPSKTSDLQNDSGFITSSDIPAQVQADWNETNTSSAAYIQNKPTIPPGVTVDQTYNASSTNAQSGTAVAEAIAEIPAAPTYSDGDGIDITSNVISADVDGVTIGIDSTTHKIKSLQTIPTKTSDLQNDSGFITSSDIPAIPTKTSDLQNDSGFITSSDIPAQVQANWNESNSSSAAYIQNKPSIPTVDQTYNASSTNAQSGVAVASAVAGVNAVPASTSADATKVLTVDSNGTPGWAASAVPASKPLVQGSGITITDGQNDVTISVNADQTYNASSTNAQSGVAVASAIAGINQVPASTSADEDKVLTVNSSGTPVWAAAQGGGGSGGSAVDYTDDSYWEGVLKQAISSVTTGFHAILKFADASFDPSSDTTITNSYTVTKLTDYDANVWLFEIDSSTAANNCLDDGIIGQHPYEALSIAYTPVAGSNNYIVKHGVSGYFTVASCTRIGNIFPVPNSSTVSGEATIFIKTRSSSSIKSIGDIDLTCFTYRISPRFTDTDSYAYSIAGDYYSIRSIKFYAVTLDDAPYVSLYAAFTGTGLTKLPIVRTASTVYGLSSTPMEARSWVKAFKGCDKLEDFDWSIRVSSLPGVQQDNDATEMLYNCKNLKHIGPIDLYIHSVDTTSYPSYNSGVVFKNAFRNCTSLNSVAFTCASNAMPWFNSSLPTISFEGAFLGSGIREYQGAVQVSGGVCVTAESLAQNVKNMFSGCINLQYVPCVFSGEANRTAEKADVSGVFNNCVNLQNTKALYDSLLASASASATTTNAFANAGKVAPDYATQSAQIPSSWGGTGA